MFPFARLSKQNNSEDSLFKNHRKTGRSWKQVVFSGILEDSTFKVPFVSHRISHPLLRNCIYKFCSAYVYEFPSDRSLLVVITEHAKIDSNNLWLEILSGSPKIESIKRPIKGVSLLGVITMIHSNSGLIKRCNKCKSIIYDPHAKLQQRSRFNNHHHQ